MSVDRDIDRELRFHFDTRIADLLAQGFSRDEAEAQALREFGDVNQVRDNLRQIDHRLGRRRRRADRLEGVRQDIAYAVRSLSRAPVVSLTIILTLALGLGANAAMFSLIDEVFLRAPAGVAHPENIRRVWTDRHFGTGPQSWPSYDYSQFAVLEQAVSEQADVALFSDPEMRKLGRDDSAPNVAVAGASANYFRVLGVEPQRGRFFHVDEGRVDVAPPVVVISDAFWKRQFDRDPDAVGKQVEIAREKLVIIGIAPPRFTGTELDATDVWLLNSALIGNRTPDRLPWWKSPNINGFQVLMRLHPNANEVTLMQRATIALRGPNIGYRQDTLAIARFGSIVAARGPGTLKAEIRVATRVAGVAIIVLLIACANVVNLLLARAVKRRREIALRLALGISRGRLVRMLVTESVVLAIVAVLAAVAAAFWGGALLRSLLMPEVHFGDTPLHWRVLVFALLVAVVAGILAGLVPAMQATSPDLAGALKAGSQSVKGVRSRLRNSLVVVQAALSVVLLIGAMLFVQSLRNVQSHDIGYAVRRLSFAWVSYESRDSVRDAGMSQRIQALESRIAAIPGVERVAFTSVRPRWGMYFIKYFIPDGDTVGRKMPSGIYTAVSPEYFQTMGTRLLAGQTFGSAAHDSTAYTVIVNKAMGDRLWPNQDPIGRCIRFNKPDAPCARVIGVSQTALLNSINEDPTPHFFFPIDNAPVQWRINPTVIVRALPAQLPAINKSVYALLRTQFSGAKADYMTMSKTMEPEYRPWRLGATLFTLFGALALLVAAIGIYSTVSYAVTQRTHEFGVRIALGARVADVLRLVIGEGLRTVAIGVALGVLLTIALGRVLTTLLYGITAKDPFSMALVAAALLIIATIAALIPAWRASKADPLTALRAD